VVRIGRRRFLGAVGAGAGAVGAGLLVTGASAQGTPAAHPDPDAAQGSQRLYLGTYGAGVGLAEYRPGSGQLHATGAVPGVANPSFLALGPGGRTLYAVDEQSDGAVTALAVDPDGGLRVLGSQPTGGGDPCHLAVVDGHLLSANYGSGSVAVHPLLADGGLGARTDLVQHTGHGPDPDRQDGPHAHQVLADPTGRHVLAVDLGTDSVYTYRLDGGRLQLRSQARTAPGAGPRHLAFHPTGRFAYLACELDSTVVVCAFDPDSGQLTPGAAQPTAPAGPVRNYPAEVLVSADGRFVYLSNRGHNSVAVFATDQGGASLRPLGTVPSGGDWPRHLSLDPTGTLLFAANQNSGTVASFRVNRGTGALTPSGSELTTQTPVCVLPARSS
jgi:6-phosphogluconolactonase